MASLACVPKLVTIFFMERLSSVRARNGPPPRYHGGLALGRQHRAIPERTIEEVGRAQQPAVRSDRTEDRRGGRISERGRLGVGEVVVERGDPGLHHEDVLGVAAHDAGGPELDLVQKAAAGHVDGDRGGALVKADLVVDRTAVERDDLVGDQGGHEQQVHVLGGQPGVLEGLASGDRFEIGGLHRRVHHPALDAAAEGIGLPFRHLFQGDADFTRQVGFGGELGGPLADVIPVPGVELLEVFPGPLVRFVRTFSGRASPRPRMPTPFAFMFVLPQFAIRS